MKKCAGQCFQKWWKFFWGTSSLEYWVSIILGQPKPIRVSQICISLKNDKIRVFHVLTAAGTKRKMLGMWKLGPKHPWPICSTRYKKNSNFFPADRGTRYNQNEVGNSKTRHFKFLKFRDFLVKGHTFQGPPTLVCVFDLFSHSRHFCQKFQIFWLKIRLFSLRTVLYTKLGVNIIKITAFGYPWHLKSMMHPNIKLKIYFIHFAVNWIMKTFLPGSYDDRPMVPSDLPHVTQSTPRPRTEVVTEHRPQTAPVTAPPGCIILLKV